MNETVPELRVLVVEDDPATASGLAAFLRLYGHDVDVAKDGLTALRTAEDRPPDVALLDIGLPGQIDGCEVARRLQERATEKLPLLIAVTGFGGDEDRRRSAEAGIYLHLHKPVDLDYLGRLLERFKSIIGNE